MIPLLYQVAARAPALDDWQRGVAAEMHLDVMATMVRFEFDLLLALQALTSAGVDHAVLKGVATAHLDYASPAMRQFGDVDILVRPADVSRTLDAFHKIGWEQAYVLPRHHLSFTHAITLRSGTRVELDLHQRIAHRGLGRLIPVDELLASTESFTLGEREIRALSRPARLVHAGVHVIASRGDYRRLSSTADVLVLAEACRTDVPAVQALAERWHVWPIVVSAVADAYAQARLELPLDWDVGTSHRRGVLDRLLAHAYLSSGRRPLLEELVHLTTISRAGERLRYLRGYFATDPDYAVKTGRRGLISQSRYLLRRIQSK